MTGKLLLLTLVSVSLSAIAQIVLKTGVSTPRFGAGFAGDGVAAALAVLINPFVVAGLGLYFLGALVWLAVLSKVEVSVAYPFVGLGFLLTLALAWLFLGENVGAIRVLGTAMVAIGVCLVSLS
jgi:drug/metabolite transporter (DMT)-like permease